MITLLFLLFNFFRVSSEG